MSNYQEFPYLDLPLGEQFAGLPEDTVMKIRVLANIDKLEGNVFWMGGLWVRGLSISYQGLKRENSKALADSFVIGAVNAAVRSVLENPNVPIHHLVALRLLGCQSS